MISSFFFFFYAPAAIQGHDRGNANDTRKNRYTDFQELYLYCYYVAGTVGLMSVPVMGIAPESTLSAQAIYSAAIHLGIGNQLTNILRDVGEE